MRKTLITDLMLGFALQFFRSQDNDDAADFVEGVIAKKRAGEEVDDHMRQIADHLNSGAPLDLQGLKDRINDEVDELDNRVDAEPPADDTGDGGDGADGNSGDGGDGTAGDPPAADDDDGEPTSPADQL